MKKILLLIFILFSLLSLPARSSFAGTDIALFDEKTLYDIYLYNESKTVIRRVKILRQVEINHKNFLVIQSSDFSLSDNQGYVNFDAVSTILPSAKFKVEETRRFRLFPYSEK